VRLQAQVHLVTAASASVMNIRRCCERSNLHVADIVLEPLASAEAVLEPDEKEIGVALVDIGGGTSDIIVYVDGAVVHTSVIPIGGLNFTNDVAHRFRTPIAEAERLKIKYGCASPALVDPEEEIEVPSVGGRQPRAMARQELCGVLEPRVEELFQSVAHALEQGGFMQMLASGVVITGGTTQLEGMPEIAEQILGMQVRRASPIGIGGLGDVVKSPGYATAVGLVKYGAAKARAATRIHGATRMVEVAAPAARPRSSWASIGQWLKEVF
jgi:cell division protein FtsA